MPEISRFYGIIVRMFFDEHNLPHFHVEYKEYKVSINLNDEVVKGFMPKRALKLTFEWMELHKDELFENWEKCQKGIKSSPIESLK